MNNLSNEELVQVHATAREALLPVVWTEKKALAHYKSKITPEVVEAMASEILASREAGKEPVGTLTNEGTMFKPVADLYEMQFADGSTMAFHTDAEKAVQWLNTCDGNKVQEYVTLERFQKAYAAPQLPAVPDGWVMVPRKITLEMECALSRADSYEIGWQWAIAAAPKLEVK